MVLLSRELLEGVLQFRFQEGYALVTVQDGKPVGVGILSVFLKAELLDLLIQLFNKDFFLVNNPGHIGFLLFNPLDFPHIPLSLVVGLADQATDPGEIPLELVDGRGLMGGRVRQLDDFLVLLEQDRLVVAHQGLQLRVVVGLKLVMLAAQHLFQVSTLILLTGTILN